MKSSKTPPNTTAPLKNDPKSLAISRHEGHFISEGDGQEPSEIFYQTWTHVGSIGTLVVTHGISEHSDAYARTAVSLAERGWDVIAWDLRGHGRSEGKRGYVRDFRDYSRDLSSLLRHLNKRGSLTKPFALVGHSMGGLVTLAHITDPGHDVPKPFAMCLSSPLLGVALEVPWIKDAAAHVLIHVMPKITLYNEIKFEDLTRDPSFLNGYASDTLRHDRISPTLYLGMFKTITEVQAASERIQLPTLIQAAGKEKVVSLPAINAFFPSIGSSKKELIVYDDSYHEIFNDLDREEAFNDLDLFLRAAL